MFNCETITHRWNPENKANMDPYAFMPFGMGPRNCIANRFAQEEVKMVLCTLIKQFRFFPVEETPVRISSFNLYFFSIITSFWSYCQMKLTNDVGIGSLDPLESTVGIATRMWSLGDRSCLKTFTHFSQFECWLTMWVSINVKKGSFNSK